ncbi:MAG: hypothetical protein LBQ48_04280 [Oscillospiraceae bacterium]|jgi:RNA polymerase sigma factor (sigma-70 family)|nr:hypothetical protein [Oscillospiraceae bacterium]
MKTTHLVWKDPACGGISPEWQELNGQEFYAFINISENKGRRFIKLYSASEDGSDGDIMIEATEDEYVDWRKGKDHSDWVRKSNEEKGYQTVSYHAMETEDGCFGEELIGDPESEFENFTTEKIVMEQLSTALEVLSEDELWLVDKVYRDEKSLSEVGKLLGMSKVAVFKRLNKALTKLKNQIF